MLRRRARRRPASWSKIGQSGEGIGEPCWVVAPARRVCSGGVGTARASNPWVSVVKIGDAERGWRADELGTGSSRESTARGCAMHGECFATAVLIF